MTEIPGSHQGETAYRNVAPAQRERLVSFRASHPYHQLSIDDSTWRYIACGQGQRALLLLPGAFLKGDMWFNQICALEDDYRIIAPDAYALQGVFELEIVCEALVRSMDNARIERATVIGISAGGGVAQVLLQSHPDRVDHVVFSNCGALEYDNQKEKATTRILWLVKLLPSFVIRRMLKRMTTGNIPPSSRWIAFHEAHFREAVARLDKSTVERFLRSGLEARRRIRWEPTLLETWQGSILILSSKDDPLSRSGVGGLQARYPRARVEWLGEGGHHAFLFFPEVYTDALQRLLDDVG